MKTVSKQAICTAQNRNIAQFIERPFMDCAGCDEDFDNLTDDEREIATGLRHFAVAHGEAGQ